MRKLARASLGAAVWLLSACSGPALVNALTPTDGYLVKRDLPYGDDARQRLDLYVPDEAPPTAPLLVFFYGGRWESGSKDLYPFVGQAFASRGYITAVADYRLYPQVRYREILEDGAAAVATASRLVGGGHGVVLVGHSAGAYIAAMLALDQRLLAAAEVDRCRIAAAIGLSGPYDFLPLDDDTLRQIFGPGPAGPETQPISYVDPADPPMLLATGSDDTTVKPGNTIRLAERLSAAGVVAESRVYDGLNHVRVVAALAAPLRFLAPVLDDVDGFVRRETARPRQACSQ